MEWEVLAHGFGLAEAPTVDVDGSLLFSDVLGGGIFRLDASADMSTVVPKRRGVGGIAIHADGGFVCSGRDLLHVRDGHDSRTVLHVDGVAGWNDICTDASGRVYAGALRFAVFDPAADVVPGELWRVDESGDAAPIIADIAHANGVACAPDGSAIFLSDTRRQQLILFDTQRGTRRAVDLAELGNPDGMAIDDHGAVWLALVRGGIARITPDGEVDQRIEPPSAFTTSLCFDGRDLYVTTGNHSERPELGGCVLRTRVERAGAPIAPARC